LPDPEPALYSRSESSSATWQVMAGRNDGLASIYLSCRGLLARAVRRIVRSHDVEDILQEAFVRSFEAEARTPIRDVRAFLLRTATNLAINHVSRAEYRTTGPIDGLDEAATLDSGAPTPDQIADADQRFLSFCRAIGSLPDQCRRVFVLKKVYGLSQEEIASHVGISTSTVEKHIARGLLLCRQHMLDEAIAPVRIDGERQRA
jgi:RNA polymerase sigma-70 factor (ECF subfamily)